MPETAARQAVLDVGTDDAQFRLARIQLFNWGTFSGITDISVPAEGYLFVGPSGSGKSTILDAHAALTTPPLWAQFNVAARESEKNGRDRSLMTYVRGAYRQATNDDGEVAAQYLRSDTTWSALAETYRSDAGQVVTLAQVMWVRGKSSVPQDVHRIYLVVQRELDVADLEFFARHDFDVRRFKFDLPDAAVAKEFSGYQERFRGLLGIDSERALRLLHKTQSAKNLGDLNVFLRDFMLDPPETITVARRLVDEFVELNDAHQAVVTAREQIKLLEKAEDFELSRQSLASNRGLLKEVAAGVEQFRDELRMNLLEQHQRVLLEDLNASQQKLAGFREVADQEQQLLEALRRQRGEQGGNVIEELERQKQDADAQKPDRLKKRELATAACAVLDWEMPQEVLGFVSRTEEAKARVSAATARSQALQSRRDAAKAKYDAAVDQLKQVRAEVDAMERQPSNIPSAYLEARAQLADALGLKLEQLPFAGELLEVRKSESAWRGAIERVLHGFALSILVSEKDYVAVSSYLNDHHVGIRLVYNRMIPQTASAQTAQPNSLFGKLEIAKCPQAAWLREELKGAYSDFICVNFKDLHHTRRGVTMQGQVRHNSTRHEKNDRYRVDDRRQWVLGFDNKEKLALFKAKAFELAQSIVELEKDVKAVENEQALERDQDRACIFLQTLSWSDVDVASLLTRIQELEEQIERELQQRPDLAALDEKIGKQDEKARKAAQARDNGVAHELKVQDELLKYSRLLDEQSKRLLNVALTPTQRESLEGRLAKVQGGATLDNLDRVVNSIDRAIAAEIAELDLQIAQRRAEIKAVFVKFNDKWAAKSGGLDPTMDSASEYFAKLEHLRKDGLHTFEDRFFKLLQEQSVQNVTLLASKLEQERSAIRTRMDVVRESLLNAPYNPGTHLTIETNDKTLEEVRQFKASLRDAFSNTFSPDRVEAEARFEVLRALVKRLGSQDLVDQKWRELVLDVRQHVEFVAREIEDDTGREVDVYYSGAGKSGGQRQKLTSTCLAAALRYQLGGQHRTKPMFATVVLDEAFDKTDPEFTAMAMNIFKEFGFQMVVATPMKSVMTLEPFIGGACFVENRDRKTSKVLRIDYDSESKRLKLPQGVADASEAAVA